MTINPKTASLSDAEKGLLLDRMPVIVAELEAEISRVIVGQREVVRQILIALLAGGHCLINGVPGLAKTLIIKTIAAAMDLKFNRVQFTPDLMPSDLLGTEVIEEDLSTGRKVARFIRGPVFANIVLADEINRTPPKTQAALLEAMQERQVTIAGIRYDLDEPFFVLATENPIEMEGTYSLPEAQLDRFMFNVLIDYPTKDEEMSVIAQTTSPQSACARRVLDGRQLTHMQMIVREIPAAANVIDYVARLIRATRPSSADALPFAAEWVKWGAGPRAGQAFVLGAKAMALLDGRFTVTSGDVRSIARPVLRHRLILNFHADAEGVTPDDLIDRLLNEVPVDARP